MTVDQRRAPRSPFFSGFDDENWRADAACADITDPDLFFPIGASGPYLAQIEVAKAICAGCPAQAECLHFAVTTNQQFGVWGGLDEDERRELRRRWRNTKAPLEDSTDRRLRPAAS